MYVEEEEEENTYVFQRDYLEEKHKNHHQQANNTKIKNKQKQQKTARLKLKRSGVTTEYMTHSGREEWQGRHQLIQTNGPRGSPRGRFGVNRRTTSGLFSLTLQYLLNPFMAGRVWARYRQNCCLVVSNTQKLESIIESELLFIRVNDRNRMANSNQSQ